MPDPVATEDLSDLGKFLRGKREERHLSQNDVSKLIDVAQSTLSEYERGVLSPSLASARKLARLFECTVDEIANQITFPE